MMINMGKNQASASSAYAPFALGVLVLLALLAGAPHALAPSAPADVTIVPLGGTYTTLFTATASGSVDPEGDDIYYYYRWIDSENNELSPFSTSGSLQCSLSLGCLGGNTIYVQAKAVDNNSLESDITTASVVLGNVPPGQPPAPVLAPTNPNKTSTISVTSPDPGSLPINIDPDYGPGIYVNNVLVAPYALKYDWSIGGNTLKTGLSTSGDASSFNCAAYPECVKNSELTLSLSTYDGADYSPASTASVTIGDRLPAPFTVDVTPRPAIKDNTFTATYTGGEDPDCDDGTYTSDCPSYDYRWEIIKGGSTPQVVGSNSPTYASCQGDGACVAGSNVQVTVTRSPCPPPESGYACSVSASTVVSPRWEFLAFQALMVSVIIVAIIYMVGMALSMEQLKTIARDELYQILATALLIGAIVALLYFADNSFKDIGAALGAPPDATSLQDAATGMLQNNLDYTKQVAGAARKLTVAIGEVSTRSAYCSMLGVGYSVSSCTAINALRSPLSQLYSALTIAILDFQSEILLLKLGSGFFATALLPIGVFFRAFRITRPAGGALIAISLGFFIILPASVLFSELMVTSALDQAEFSSIRVALSNPNYVAPLNHERTLAPDYYTIGASSTKLDCDAYNPALADAMEITNAISEPSFFEPIVFLVVIRAVFMTAFNLLVTLTAIRWMAGILGTDIDVSSLARLS